MALGAGVAEMIYRGAVVTNMDLADLLMHQQDLRPSRRQTEDHRCDEKPVEESPRDEGDENGRA